VPLSLPIEPEATKLLYANPLALLTGMLLDQHIDECMLTAWSTNSLSGPTSGT
jgi:hypothetical protein